MTAQLHETLIFERRTTAMTCTPPLYERHACFIHLYRKEEFR